MPVACSEMAGFTSVHSPIILRNTTTTLTKQIGPPDIPNAPGNTTNTNTNTTCPITNASNTTTITNTSSHTTTTTTTTTVLLFYYYY